MDELEDIVIKITGESPLLNTIWVYRNESVINKLLPDLTNDGKVNFEDLSELASAWLTIYDLESLLTISDNWLKY